MTRRLLLALVLGAAVVPVCDAGRPTGYYYVTARKTKPGGLQYLAFKGGRLALGPASSDPESHGAASDRWYVLGTQIKCATCHDSFTSRWTQAELWGLATIFADGPMEIARCEKPTGKFATPGFLFPELGTIDSKLPRPQQVQRLAELVTSKENGLLPRTIVNRLWSRLMGRGLVEPVDNMEDPAWDPDLLDWLAGDLVAHNYDLKRDRADYYQPLIWDAGNG